MFFLEAFLIGLDDRPTAVKIKPAPRVAEPSVPLKDAVAAETGNFRGHGRRKKI